MPRQAEKVTQEIDAKEAVKIAMDYFRELFGTPFADLALEEIDKSGNAWQVTLGYMMGRAGPAGTVVVVPGAVRQYKSFTIDATTGEVKSMKVRKF